MRILVTHDLNCEENVVTRKWKCPRSNCVRWTPEVTNKRSVSRWTCNTGPPVFTSYPTTVRKRSTSWSTTQSCTFLVPEWVLSQFSLSLPPPKTSAADLWDHVRVQMVAFDSFHSCHVHVRITRKRNPKPRRLVIVSIYPRQFSHRSIFSSLSLFFMSDKARTRVNVV